MASLVLSKPVGKKHLNLESYMREERPIVPVYLLSLADERGVWGRSGEVEIFLPAFYSELLNMPLYKLIYDAIETEEDFIRLKADLGDKIKALYENITDVNVKF